jgi:hypothetical protein
MSTKNKTNYYMTFEFDYQGEKQQYDWNMSFEAVCLAIRTYFDHNLVTLDGTDGAIWNLLLSDLNVDIFDLLEKDYVVDIVFSKFKDEIMEDFQYEWDYDHEGE